jgi:hypothetical protein
MAIWLLVKISKVFLEWWPSDFNIHQKAGWKQFTGENKEDKKERTKVVFSP